jgi:hypothetical protein
VNAVAVALIAIVFLWSGVAKLRSPWLTSMAMVDFGIVRRIGEQRPRERLGQPCGGGNCMCFGKGGEQVSAKTLARTGGLFVIALGTAVSATGGAPFPGLRPEALAMAEAASCLGIVVMVASVGPLWRLRGLPEYMAWEEQR